MNTLRQAAQEYLAMRRSLGFRLCKSGPRLLDFVTFMEEHQAAYITVPLALFMLRPGECLHATSHDVKRCGRHGQPRPTCSCLHGVIDSMAGISAEPSMRYPDRSDYAARASGTGRVCMTCATDSHRGHCCAGTKPARTPSGDCRHCRHISATSTGAIHSGI